MNMHMKWNYACRDIATSNAWRKLARLAAIDTNTIGVRLPVELALIVDDYLAGIAKVETTLIEIVDELFGMKI